jgi:hypothetical protein
MSHNAKIPQNTFSVEWATLGLPIPYRQKFRVFSGKAEGEGMNGGRMDFFR